MLGDLVHAEGADLSRSEGLGFGCFSLSLGCAQEGALVAGLLSEVAGVGRGGEGGGGFVGGVEGERPVEDFFGEDFVGGGWGECLTKESTGDLGGSLGGSHREDGGVGLAESRITKLELYSPSLYGTSPSITWR